MCVLIDRMGDSLRERGRLVERESGGEREISIHTYARRMIDTPCVTWRDPDCWVL